MRERLCDSPHPKSPLLVCFYPGFEFCLIDVSQAPFLQSCSNLNEVTAQEIQQFLVAVTGLQAKVLLPSQVHGMRDVLIPVREDETDQRS